MAEEGILEEDTPLAETAHDAPADSSEHRSRRTRVLKWVVGILAAVVALIVVALTVLNSPIGQRLIADRIAQFAPGSGLRIEIGRIEGNIYGSSVLHDVVLSDPVGPFMMIPEVDLDWRPFNYFRSGLDIRELALRRGRLMRTPELLPCDAETRVYLDPRGGTPIECDPDAPLLPDINIRLDRFVVDNLMVAPGVAGPDAQRVDLVARADIREGRVFATADGKLGQRDTLHALVDSEPDRNRFDIELDYDAPRDGVIAGLIGAQAGYKARIYGDGTWSAWRGGLRITREGESFGAFRLAARDGRYFILGRANAAAATQGMVADILGDHLRLAADGTLDASVLSGEVKLWADALDVQAQGAIDLDGNAAENLRVAAQLKQPELLGPDLRLEDASVTAVLDGALRDLSIGHELEVGRLVSGESVLTGLTQEGVARYDGSRWTVPLDARVARVETGNELLDPRLVNGTLGGTITYTGTRLFSDGLAIAFPGASARLALQGDLGTGSYELSGPVAMNGLELENIGLVNAGADIVFRTGSSPWTLRADFDGRIPRVLNATLANLAGPDIRFSGGVSLGGAAPLTFRNVRMNAAKLQLTLDGRIVEGRTSLAGRGRHVEYGPFTVQGQLTDAGPEAVLVFANPLPSAGLEDVRVAISPVANGFRIETRGGSMLGPFDGLLNLYSPPNGPTRIVIDRLDVWRTAVTGELLLLDAGVRGDLALAGGGLDGTIALAPRDGGQGFDIDLAARNASFGGETPITLARADIQATGLLRDGNSTVSGSLRGQGLSYGNLFIGRIAARAELTNGRGEVTAALSGRRGSRFALQMNARIAPEQIAVAARGEYGGRSISMPRRAVLVKQDGGGWRLEPSQLTFGGGLMVASGEFGGGETALNLQLSKMPLSLVDVVVADVGLGGTVSGLIDYRTGASGVPTADVRVKVDDLTRSGLVLSSQPMDLALVLRLTQNRLETRAVIDEGGQRRGRLQGVITGLPASGGLYERLAAGDLFAQLRYSGPAAALWRLAAIDTFDLTGPLSIAADVRGSLANPSVRGSLASNGLRVQSVLSGTDIRNVTARGSFSGSRLRLTSFSGTAPNGGTVIGSGIVDLAQMGAGRGPQLDIRVAARNARLLDSRGLSATVTGPLRIVSDGVGGTIAGRVVIDRASWRFGTAASAEQLPRITTREINTPADIAPRAQDSQPWRYLVDARAASRVDVDGMGLDSEWAADIILRGTTEDPRIGGEARVIRGSYSFAGTRFELTRGRIDFDDNAPIDPRLDILAETERDGIDFAVAVRGNALTPEISFTSNPALPEEEILSRLLFGGSITELSATDALQLGAAVASLRGGGGMDPINQLRTAIGLDRLRIVSADPAINRGTAIALGKNFGRRFYGELITDGRGYSATEVEFRVTSWLSLLATVSTIGRESVRVEVSRDY